MSKTYNTDLIVEAGADFLSKLEDANATTEDEQIHLLCSMIAGLVIKGNIQHESVVKTLIGQLKEK